MKTLLTLLCLLPFVLLAQTNEPEKRNNTILVSTADDYPAVMRRMVGILSDLGYGIQTVDKDLGILTTTSKGYPGGTLALNIHVKEGPKTEVVIRGTTDSNLSLIGEMVGKPINIMYYGMKGSALRLAWDEMDKVAKAYPSASVSYLSN
jgi:hypothetical protein